MEWPFGYITDDEQDELFKLFIPKKVGRGQAYWAFDPNGAEDTCLGTEFTPLRQTIVLLMAAMNNEL